jgi:hypothetical protein
MHEMARNQAPVFAAFERDPVISPETTPLVAAERQQEANYEQREDRRPLRESPFRDTGPLQNTARVHQCREPLVLSSVRLIGTNAGAQR